MSITRVGIVGTGIMGTGIAEVAAASGHAVIVRSRTRSAADSVLAGVKRSLDRQIERGARTEEERDEILSRISVTTELKDLAEVDLVIESVIENLAVKLELFEDLHGVCAEATVLATNTSTLPVVDLAMASGRPTKVCGIHFFNPATAMGLVEIVRPITASEETITAVTEFAKACGKEIVEVEDRAGFVVNALLFPYLNNAVKLLERGVASKEGIDAAMVGGCGFPMGPFALLDLVGIDTSVAILDTLYEEHREPQYAAAPLLRRMMAAQHLGRKSSQGFYEYKRR
ncbi:MAG TPA: 3-hydroxybutyryl-CoA dehydrogenase [Acidimicrobiales bacterium]|nr:3-hydroxybutyryl-CoA dehydrogenase [Acidimicrobiales bacterium]